MPGKTLYEQDLYAWGQKQAALLRAGRTAEAEIHRRPSLPARSSWPCIWAWGVAPGRSRGAAHPSFSAFRSPSLRVQNASIAFSHAPTSVSGRGSRW